MHTIGERLEEARKRQGISIREAAEATKIRSDFLDNMEQNLFNFQLPEIYRRGFLRVYGTYLKLDADKLLTDYNALLLGSSRARRGRGSYGTLEAGESEEAPVSAVAESAEAAEAASESPVSVDPHQYLKIGGVIVGTIVLLILLIVGTRAFFGGNDTPPSSPVAEEHGSVVLHYVFSGKDDISSLTISNNGKRLFSGPVRKGQKVPVSFEGEIEVLCTQVQNLAFETNGKTLGFGGNGIGKAYLPPRQKAL